MCFSLTNKSKPEVEVPRLFERAQNDPTGDLAQAAMRRDTRMKFVFLGKGFEGEEESTHAEEEKESGIGSTLSGDG